MVLPGSKSMLLVDPDPGKEIEVDTDPGKEIEVDQDPVPGRVEVDPDPAKCSGSVSKTLLLRLVTM